MKGLATGEVSGQSGGMFVEIALVVVLAVGVALLFRTLVRKASVTIEGQYRRLAERLGLELNVPSAQMFGFVRPEPSVFGRWRGREISVAVPGKGLQNTRQIETVLKVELRNEALTAQLAPTGMLGGLRQRDSLGKLRWRSGDDAFDAAVDIRTEPGHPLDGLLTPERREWLARQLQASKGTIYIGGGTMAYAEFGLIANDRRRERFEAMAGFFCDLADEVEPAPGRSEDRDSRAEADGGSRDGGSP